MVESVLVRCEVTGHTYRWEYFPIPLWRLNYPEGLQNFFYIRFPCGRYLGKSIDDGSTERLLVGELLKVSEPESVDIGGYANAPPVQCRSPMMSRRDTRLSVAEVQHMIGTDVFKHFCELQLQPQQWRMLSLAAYDTCDSISTSGDSVNNIVKYFHRFTTTRQRENCASLTPLLCGEMGLVHSLEQAFLYGFKATRLFGRNLYLWDYFSKCLKS